MPKNIWNFRKWSRFPVPNNSHNAVNSDLPECLILSQYIPAVLCFNYFKRILRLQQHDSWEPKPRLKLLSAISHY